MCGDITVTCVREIEILDGNVLSPATGIFGFQFMLQSDIVTSHFKLSLTYILTTRYQ